MRRAVGDGHFIVPLPARRINGGHPCLSGNRRKALRTRAVRRHPAVALVICLVAARDGGRADTVVFSRNWVAGLRSSTSWPASAGCFRHAADPLDGEGNDQSTFSCFDAAEAVPEARWPRPTITLGVTRPLELAVQRDARQRREVVRRAHGRSRRAASSPRSLRGSSAAIRDSRGPADVGRRPDTPGAAAARRELPRSRRGCFSSSERTGGLGLTLASGSTWLTVCAPIVTSGSVASLAISGQVMHSSAQIAAMSTRCARGRARGRNGAVRRSVCRAGAATNRCWSKAARFCWTSRIRTSGSRPSIGGCRSDGVAGDHGFEREPPHLAEAIGEARGRHRRRTALGIFSGPDKRVRACRGSRRRRSRRRTGGGNRPRSCGGGPRPCSPDRRPSGAGAGSPVRENLGVTSSRRFGWNRSGRAGRTLCNARIAPTPPSSGRSATCAPLK